MSEKLGFNGLTAKEWCILSKNVLNEDDLYNPVWDDLQNTPKRNRYALEHGATYPVSLAKRLIRMYTPNKEGGG
jgi:DNA modification methylase